MISARWRTCLITRRLCLLWLLNSTSWVIGCTEQNTALQDAEMLVAPPSTSGRVGVISTGTILKFAKLRSQGVKVVIITGARLSTLLMRLPYLPAADAFVCENACPMAEDMEWRQLQQAAGPSFQDIIHPLQRQGLLWSWYQHLHTDGWTIDANGYTTNFRVHAKNGKTMAELQQLILGMPQGLKTSFNLGAADFYPATSGKVAAAIHLMDKFGIQQQDTTFLCDDDNDMELAAHVGKAFLPTVTSDSVARAVSARPDHFVRATASETQASEEMLDAIAAHYGLPI